MINSMMNYDVHGEGSWSGFSEFESGRILQDPAGLGPGYDGDNGLSHAADANGSNGPGLHSLLETT